MPSDTVERIPRCCLNFSHTTSESMKPCSSTYVGINEFRVRGGRIKGSYSAEHYDLCSSITRSVMCTRMSPRMNTCHIR